MKKVILSILTGLILCSTLAQAGGDWFTSISSFLNDNKKYISYGLGLVAGGALLYSQRKNIVPLVKVLATGGLLYAGYKGYNFINSEEPKETESTTSSEIKIEKKYRLEQQDSPDNFDGAESADEEESIEDDAEKLKQKYLEKLQEELAKKKRELARVQKALEEERATEEGGFPHVTAEGWNKVCSALPLPNKNYDITQRAVGPAIFEDIIDRFISSETDRLEKAKWLHQKFNPNQTETFQPFVQKLEVESGDVIAIHGDLHGDIHSLLQSLEDLKNKGYMDPHNSFKIKKNSFKLIFLGDYVDRGWYGPEVIYTILWLKLLNPDNVFLVRGNHEDANINNDYINNGHGFTQQYAYMYFVPMENKNAQADAWEAKARAIRDKIKIMYSLMPVALYMGSKDTSGNKDFIQCCHGGMEIGYNPNRLLQSYADHELIVMLNNKSNWDAIIKNLLPELSREEKIEFDKDMNDTYNQLPNAYKVNIESDKFINYRDQCGKCTFGFMWNDFIIQPEGFLGRTKDRGLIHGKGLTYKILQAHSSDTHRVKGVFRAHQHTPEMIQRIANTDRKGHDHDKGCGKLWIMNRDQQQARKLWPGIVCTFSVSPHTDYYERMEEIENLGETYGLLKIKRGFENWKLEMVRLNEHKKKHVREEDEEV